jgi:hypothetical protein
VPQTVTATGVDDNLADSDQIYHVVFGATTSNDAAYVAIPIANINITNDDNDSAGIIVSPISGNTTELGGTATFTVRLNSQPFGDVTVHFDSNDATEGSVDVTSLTFDSMNPWNTPRTVTVTGLPDGVSDCQTTYGIAFTATTGGDPVYNLITPATVSLKNFENVSGICGYAIDWQTSSRIDNSTCQPWLDFTSTLTGSFSSVTFRGSENPTGKTCSDAMAATQICNALQSKSTVSVACGGDIWNVGPCGNDYNNNLAMEISINRLYCQCQSGAVGQYTLRPCIFTDGCLGCYRYLGGVDALNSCTTPNQTMQFDCIR